MPDPFTILGGIASGLTIVEKVAKVRDDEYVRLDEYLHSETCAVARRKVTERLPPERQESYRQAFGRYDTVIGKVAREIRQRRDKC